MLIYKNNDFLKKLLIDNEIDYLKIKEESYIKIYDDDVYDISFVVPVRGRKNFINTLYESFKKSSVLSEIRISLTIVEVSNISEYKDFCNENKINYIFIESDTFNKCLAMNFGAIFSVKSKSFIFHDLDCILPNNFFINLQKNLLNKNTKVIQCFNNRRLLYMNEKITNLVIDGIIDIDNLSIDIDGVDVDPSLIHKAPGGSIYIERDIFFEVGGYDPEFFHSYAPEDAFFLEKVEMITHKLLSCDSPVIELFHMKHAVEINANSHLSRMMDIYQKFIDNDEYSKLELILRKKSIIRDFYSDNNTPNELENLLINKLLNKDNLIPTQGRINAEKPHNQIINTRPILNNEHCSCGQIKNKVKYNFCTRCNKLY